MTSISQWGRIAADGVARSTASFGDQLGQAIARKGAGDWAPGPLWDAAILSMRTEGGSLAQNLELLKRFEPELFAQLSPELRNSFDSQLTAAKHIFNEIHTDQGGEFAGRLTGFHDYGSKVNAELKALLQKADEANATAARTSVEGTQVLDWTLAPSAPTAPVKVAEKAAGAVQARSVGSSSNSLLNW